MAGLSELGSPRRHIAGFGNAWYTYVEVEAKGFATMWITDLPVGQGFSIALDNTTRVRAAFELPDGSPSGTASVTFTKDKPTRRTKLGLRVRGIRLDTRTDERGRLDLPIEPGEYDVKVTADSAYFARHAKFVVDSRTVATLPALLKPGIRFEVTLLDSRTLQPIADEKVWIWERRPGLTSPRDGSERVSDPAGKLIWESLSPGDTRFGFGRENYSRRWSIDSINAKRWGQRAPQIGELSFEIVEDMAPVSIIMEKTVLVEGRVTSPSGDPVPRAWVSVSGIFIGADRFMRVADENGRYRLHLPAGNGAMFNVIAHDREGRWANAVGEPFGSSPGDALTFDLELGQGAVLEGRVVDKSGEPIAQIEVEAAPTDGRGLSYFHPRALTGEDGRFHLPPMRPGKFDVYPDSFRDVNRSNRSESAKVVVEVEDSQRLDVGDLIWTGDAPEKPRPVVRAYF